jgi:hypothetical protein
MKTAKGQAIICTFKYQRQICHCKKIKKNYTIRIDDYHSEVSKAARMTKGSKDTQEKRDPPTDGGRGDSKKKN